MVIFRTFKRNLSKFEIGMEDNTIFKISSKIKEIRKEKGITIQELADRAGVSKGLISQIENNRTVPSLLVLVNIISSLHVDLNDFSKILNRERRQVLLSYGRRQIMNLLKRSKR